MVWRILLQDFLTFYMDSGLERVRHVVATLVELVRMAFCDKLISLDLDIEPEIL